MTEEQEQNHIYVMDDEELWSEKIRSDILLDRAKIEYYGQMTKAGKEIELFFKGPVFKWIMGYFKIDP